MYTGSCLCESVKFEISGNITDIVYCHCSKCRKAQGSAFATNGNLKLVDFKFIAGEHLLTQYDSGNGQLKYFCQKCGSPIMSKNTNTPELIRVRLGTIDSAITEKPEAHIFVSSKANWEEINDSLPQHDEY